MSSVLTAHGTFLLSVNPGRQQLVELENITNAEQTECKQTSVFSIIDETLKKHIQKSLSLPLSLSVTWGVSARLP